MLFPAVAELLPHNPPMVLLDSVIAFEGKKASCELTVRPDSMFVEKGTIPSVVVLEYMAQAVGVWKALDTRSQGLELGEGYLVGTRALMLHENVVRAGDRLEVDVEALWEGDELGTFSCSVTRAGSVLATGSLSVYRPASGKGEQIR